MKTIEIFDPVMSTENGISETKIDFTLCEVAANVNILRQYGIKVIRHRLNEEPELYVSNPVVYGLMEEHNIKALPISFANGELKKWGAYPTPTELIDWVLGVVRKNE